MRIAFGSSLLAHLLVLAAVPNFSALWRPGVAVTPEEPSVITIVSLPRLETTVVAPTPPLSSKPQPPSTPLSPQPKPIVTEIPKPTPAPEIAAPNLEAKVIPVIPQPTTKPPPESPSSPLPSTPVVPQMPPPSTTQTATAASQPNTNVIATAPAEMPADGFVMGSARYRRTSQPAYPPSALKRRLEGVVILQVKIDPRGFPVSVEVAGSSGQTLLDAAAVRAVKEWEFEPETRGGKPVPTSVEVPVRFKLGR